LITNEFAKRAEFVSNSDDLNREMKSFSEGCWAAYKQLMDLQAKESVVATHRLKFDPDHWYG